MPSHQNAPPAPASPYVAEVVGATLLGDGVVANAVLKGTMGEASGWIVITFGWAVAVFVVAGASGAHLNPAVPVGLAVAGTFSWAMVPGYVAAQMLGAAIGATLVYIHYRLHFAATDGADGKLAVFATSPAIRKLGDNLVSEIIGTFVLVFGVLYIAAPRIAGPEGAPGGLGALDALPVALVVLVIGRALGGTTGYAINPARDLGPRIMHALLPVPGKRESDWGYAWVPVVGPLLGGALAALLYLALGDTVATP